ncbi:MAG: UDP-N-acetylmuramate--L-alanine ligase [Planctomyces sp.]|nr:UDP-N-acetylmuramate--L-alanine ligase [Planctomyces sp.]
MILRQFPVERSLVPLSEIPSSWRSERSLRVHLVGCGGAGMRALAEYGIDRGWRATGSDQAISQHARRALEARGMRIADTHAAGNVPADCELLIYSPAIPESNPERVVARTMGIREASYPKTLGWISRECATVAVAGTHGKSTVASLIAAVLRQAGEDPSVLVGAEALSDGRHGRAGAGRWTVIEACEYRRHFLNLSPQTTVLLGIEPDHFDCFPDVADAERAYAEFAELTPPDGVVAANADCARVTQLVRGRGNVVTYSAGGRDAAFTASQVQFGSPGVAFEVSHRGRFESRIESRLLGRYQASNLLAAYAALRSLGVNAARIAESFREFPGLRRRLERLTDWRGQARFDDYGHHPTAVAAVLETLRSSFPRGTLRCVFQPHQLSRTRALFGEFASALALADEAFVLPVFAARERSTAELAACSESLAGAVGGSSRGAFCASLDHALTTLETAGRPGDVLVTIGAGDIDRLHYEIDRRVR